MCKCLKQYYLFWKTRFKFFRKILFFIFIWSFHSITGEKLLTYKIIVVAKIQYGHKKDLKHLLSALQGHVVQYVVYHLQQTHMTQKSCIMVINSMHTQIVKTTFGLQNVQFNVHEWCGGYIGNLVFISFFSGNVPMHIYDVWIIRNSRKILIWHLKM